MIRDMDEEAIRAELAVCEAEPWEAYFTVHGEGMIVPSRMPYPSSRIADVSTSPDDYGKANTLAIAAARTGYPNAMREILRLREALAAAEARGYARGVEAAAQICDVSALDRRNTSAACQEAKYLAGTIRALDRVHADDATRSARDDALAQCAVMSAAAEEARNLVAGAQGERDAYRRHSEGLLAERNEAQRERDEAQSEARDARAERDEALAQCAARAVTSRASSSAASEWRLLAVLAERDEALAQCAVMRAALEKAPRHARVYVQKAWDERRGAALAPGAGAAFLAAIRRVLDCPPEDDHEAQTALRELIDGGGA